MALLTADVPTLLGVCSGIAVLAGLLCLVLHLYTRGRMPDIRHHHYADANMSPPMLFTSETGIAGNVDNNAICHPSFIVWSSLIAVLKCCRF